MSPKIKLCKENDCSNQQTTAGFCRFHYLKSWKKIRSDKQRKADKNLNKYIDNIVKHHSDRAADDTKKLPHPDDGIEKSLSLEDMYYNDSVRELMADLGYREDLDTLIDTIKIDEDY